MEKIKQLLRTLVQQLALLAHFPLLPSQVPPQIFTPTDQTRTR